jgi:hypothetical protein
LSAGSIEDSQQEQGMRFFSVAVTGLMAAAGWIGLAARAHAQQITIAQEGKSAYSIVVPANAPESITEAAAELQKDVALATGAKLGIQKDDAAVSGPIISLGATRQASAAGLKVEGMKPEAYRIVTNKGNLYILGPDTPDGKWTPDGGTSNGTASGVYVFLENKLGVRWLMPGDLGRDVPSRTAFMVDEMDRTDVPPFNYRRVSHTYQYSSAGQLESVIQWLHHQRIGASGGGGLISFAGSMQLSYDHSWWRTVNGERSSSNTSTPQVRALYKAHPEWFAMDASGKRPFPKNHYAKLETTNQELVKWFAQKAVEAIKSSPRPTSYSLSPSDGGGWSQSPQSMALYDPRPVVATDPEARAGRASMSSLVLKWYHDVAQTVAKELPQARLGGYIYADYIFPPHKYTMKLPDNFTPMLAASFNYGYGLYRPDIQALFKSIVVAWAKAAPANWYYYDLPNQFLRQYVGDIGGSQAPINFPGGTGIVMPAAPEILNTIFSTIVEGHMKGVMLYGLPAWSNGAMSNYIMAQMAWNPKRDAHEIQREWLTRAYGPEAGKAMEAFYKQLDQWVGDYYRQGKGMRYHLTFDTLRDVYAAHYGEMEKLFLAARSKPMNKTQAARLQLIEDNLVVLQWRLRNVGFLPSDFGSDLKRSNEEVIAILERKSPDFSSYPGAVETEPIAWNHPRPTPWKVRFDSSAPASHDALPAKLEGNTIVLCATRDGAIRITPRLVRQGAYFASYAIEDGSGVKVAAGVLNKGTPVVVQAKAGDAYYLTIPPRTGVNYVLSIQDAALAQGSYDGKTKTLMLSGKPAAVAVFFVPGNAPIGAREEDGQVLIQKPFAGAEQVSMLLQSGQYSEARVLASLTDDWRFSPDPKNDLLKRGVTKSDFDDSAWKTVSTLNWWQMQGFPDYHGSGWYRIKFTLPPLKDNEQTRLYFGSADGNVEIFLNGHEISGRQLGPAPNYDGWNKRFSRHVARNEWATGENILAVRVTSKNATSASGITGGVAVIGRVPKK